MDAPLLTDAQGNHLQREAIQNCQFLGVASMGILGCAEKKVVKRVTITCVQWENLDGDVDSSWCALWCSAIEMHVAVYKIRRVQPMYLTFASECVLRYLL